MSPSCTPMVTSDSARNTRLFNRRVEVTLLRIRNSLKIRRRIDTSTYSHVNISLLVLSCFIYLFFFLLHSLRTFDTIIFLIRLSRTTFVLLRSEEGERVRMRSYERYLLFVATSDASIYVYTYTCAENESRKMIEFDRCLFK